MKSKLPILTILVGVLVGVGWVLGQGEAGQSPPAPPAGNQMVAQAVQQLSVTPALIARVRLRVHLLGQDLRGKGYYAQRGTGRRQEVRMDMLLRSSGQTANMIQIRNSRFLWVINQRLDGRTSIGRVDLRVVRNHLIQTDIRGLTAQSMALGALPQLLAQLGDYFQFSAPQPATMRKVPVWLVDGTWRPEVAKKLAEQAKGGRLPPHLPEQVRLILGRGGSFPLFPYRIEYQRYDDDQPRAATPGRHATKPIMTLELIEVQHPQQIDPMYFRYDPGDQQVEDLSGTILDTIASGPDNQ